MLFVPTSLFVDILGNFNPEFFAIYNQLTLIEKIESIVTICFVAVLGVQMNQLNLQREELKLQRGELKG